MVLPGQPCTLGSGCLGEDTEIQFRTDAGVHHRQGDGGWDALRYGETKDQGHAEQWKAPF